MNFFSEAWDDTKDLVGGVAKVGKDIIMAPAEIAHWALGEMFGAGDLEKIAAELADLGKQVDTLGKDINTALGKLNWHGPASDAFVDHAHGRVREIANVADQLDGLSKAVTSLNNVY
ncbi:WXG100 family type VII secretion target [Kitasatospora sp. NPDC056138]|uniref:WXG100 family type VII secretion target n=1 Tax=Kitasatospora sp. NPDC056138 TaxID=3345724 RepID=UPI0035D91039